MGRWVSLTKLNMPFFGRVWILSFPFTFRTFPLDHSGKGKEGKDLWPFLKLLKPFPVANYSFPGKGTFPKIAETFHSCSLSFPSCSLSFPSCNLSCLSWELPSTWSLLYITSQWSWALSRRKKSPCYLTVLSTLNRFDLEIKKLLFKGLWHFFLYIPVPSNCFFHLSMSRLGQGLKSHTFQINFKPFKLFQLLITVIADRSI